jgi:hypothetical protein
VVLESDPGAARAIGRRHIARYLDLPNYTNNLRRLGFTSEDTANRGSDRLVDGLVRLGKPRRHLHTGQRSPRGRR